MKNFNYTSEARQDMYPLHYCLSLQHSDMLSDVYEIFKDEIPNKHEFFNRKDENGYTPMHIFAMCNALKVGRIKDAEYLKSQGADLNIKDNNGNTPFHIWAIEHKGLIKTLDRYSPESSEQVPQFVLQSSLPFFGWMLINGYNTKAKNHNNLTALDLLKQVAPENTKVDEKSLIAAYNNWAKDNTIQNQEETHQSKDIPSYVYGNHAQRYKDRSLEAEKKGCCIMM
ncbi:ankyrin repeat domain-containing protein [Candidatus Jidaibacter acanthamoebae]|nr:hypothetical protein [Candidatus Jidaibacter acanthamoeba]